MGIETLAIASLAGSVAGAGIGAAGSLMKGQAESAAAQYQAAIARNNAQLAMVNAQRQREAGDIQTMAQGLKSAALIGSQKTVSAANGLDVGVGSPADVRASTAELGRLDELTIAHKAATEAFGSEVQATNFMNEAFLKKKAAGYAETAGEIGAVSSLVGGASSFSDKWMSFGAKGVGGKSAPWAWSP
jgi:hypothetical protein